MQRSVTSVVFVTSLIYSSPYVFTLVQEICQNLPHLFNIDLVCFSFIPAPLNIENFTHKVTEKQRSNIFFLT